MNFSVPKTRMMVIGNVEVTSLMVEKNAEIRGVMILIHSVQGGPTEFYYGKRSILYAVC